VPDGEEHLLDVDAAQTAATVARVRLLALLYRTSFDGIIDLEDRVATAGVWSKIPQYRHATVPNLQPNAPSPHDRFAWLLARGRDQQNRPVV
jgi:hypothetical protein